jgi:large subunit ribosomal protein L33
MAKKKKPFVKFQCQECKRINYYLGKSKQESIERKLELKKFCKWCGKNTLHKETKK